MPDLSYRYVALTDTGLRRSTNQDSGFASPHLLVIADGMGGAAAGDLASSETMYALRKLDHDIDGDPVEALAGAVSRANDRLNEVITNDPSVEGMGTTLTALLFDGEQFTMAHIGDSRGYRLRAGELQQITDDHTFVQSLVDEGRLTPQQAREHPHRSLILRALLGRDDNDADLSTVVPEVGDRYLLCSDGLSDMVDDAHIAQALASENIDMAAVALIELALEGGGVDNVTVIIGEVVDADTPVDDRLACADGQPQLVGAAADQARPPTGRAVAGTQSLAAPVDPEELRYSPRAPSKRRWIGWTLVALLLIAVVGAGSKLAYDWTQDQFYVSEHDGYVAVFRGVAAEIPGLDLSEVERVSDIDVESLPSFSQTELREGIEAANRSEADETVERLRKLAGDATPDQQPTPTPTPSPIPTPTASPTADPSVTPAAKPVARRP